MNLKEFKDLNVLNNIPIMRDNTINHLYSIINKINNCEILEIGTALGYSSFFLAQSKQVKSIITLEKDLKRFEFAKNILFKFDNVKCINTSAFDFVSDKKFDVIILDGPKSHQDQLFDKFKNNLKNGGMFFIDNLYLKKISANNNLTKNQSKLITKLNVFNLFLDNLDKNLWLVEKYDVDDGYALVYSKN